MRLLARLSGVPSPLSILGIPVALLVIGIRPEADDEPRPGESRLGFHLRTCPDCDPDEPHSRSLNCPGFATLVVQIREQFLTDYGSARYRTRAAR